MGTDPGDDEGERGRRAASAAGAAAAAGAAVTGAQALLGMDVAEAATEGGGDSVVPLGDAPAPVDDVDLDGDVDTFLAEDTAVGPADAGTPDTADPLDDPLAGLDHDADAAAGDLLALDDADVADDLEDPSTPDEDDALDGLDL